MVLLSTLVDQLTTDQWEVQLLISVMMITLLLSMEVPTPGPVRVMDSGVGQLQCVKVGTLYIN